MGLPIRLSFALRAINKIPGVNRSVDQRVKRPDLPIAFVEPIPFYHAYASCIPRHKAQSTFWLANRDWGFSAL